MPWFMLLAPKCSDPVARESLVASASIQARPSPLTCCLAEAIGRGGSGQSGASMVERGEFGGGDRSQIPADPVHHRLVQRELLERAQRALQHEASAAAYQP